MTNIYLICPVRKATKEEKEFLNSYVNRIEAEGYTVHYPPRNANQTDPIGNQICDTHAEAMSKADEVHLFYSETSTGSLVDLGMAYLLRHLRLSQGRDLVFRLINRDAVEEAEKQNPNKNYRKVMIYLDDQYRKKET